MPKSAGPMTAPTAFEELVVCAPTPPALVVAAADEPGALVIEESVAFDSVCVAFAFHGCVVDALCSHCQQTQGIPSAQRFRGVARRLTNRSLQQPSSSQTEPSVQHHWFLEL